jgi:hypothetical protein
MFRVMDDVVQKLSTLTGTECHILLYCQGIGLWIEVKWYANYSYGNALDALSGSYSSNTFLKIFVECTTKLILCGIVK